MVLDLHDLPCDLCRVKDEELLFEKPGQNTRYPFRVVRCKRCGLIYINPRPSTRMMSSLYDNDFIDQRRNHVIGGINPYESMKYSIKAIAPEDATILDYGCGGGFLMEMLRFSGYTVHGFDISPDAVRICKKNGFVTFSDSIDIPDNTYDMVIAIEVVEHCFSPMQVFSDARRALKVGGKFLFTTGNFEHFYENCKYIQPEQHLNFFSMSQVKEYYKKAGFSRVENGEGWPPIAIK